MSPADELLRARAGAGTFRYRGDELYCEDVPLAELAARFGTPLYVYSGAAIAERYHALRAAFGAQALICYAVKANPNLGLLRRCAELGTGFDLVSGGELLRLQAAGLATEQAVFAGVAKEPWEIAAALAADIRMFVLESPHELALLSAAGAAAGRRVRVLLRLNPDIGAGTHDFLETARHSSKFGVDLAAAGPLVERIAGAAHLQLVGYHVHLGSQLRTIAPYLRAFDRVEEFLAGAAVRTEGIDRYDLGGGFGGGGDGAPLEVAALAQALLPRLQAHGLQPVLEPGRYLVGDAGVLLTSVLGDKGSLAQRFLLVDAAMNDLLRPALYRAEHPMAPVRRPAGAEQLVDVVGPVCETGDFLARRRLLPPLQRGDLLAVFAAGAYGAAMASNYNSRRRPAEVLVDGSAVRSIRRREAFDRLWTDEVEA